MPPIVTVAEYSANSAHLLGREVVLQGYLLQGNDREFYLVETPASQIVQPGGEGHVKLIFGEMKPDSTKITDCMDRMTLVIGYAKGFREVEVHQVKRKSDALIHKESNCYQFPD